jgi:tetratricopeptide (TPR) repeat protein
VRHKLIVVIVTASCSFLLFPASNVHAQGMSRIPGGPLRPIPPSLSDPVDPFANMQPKPAAPAYRAPLAETVSVHDLAIPEKAEKEFQRSMKAYEAHDFAESVSHLQKATKIAPEFVQAHNNLGASYLNLNQYNKAVIEFQKAIDLDSNLEEPYHNIGLAFFVLHRFPEAEAATRRALDLAPERSNARYMLGRILAMENSHPAEAIELLRQATPEFPEARLPLAAVLIRQGALDQAAAELRGYLNEPDPEKKQLAECWLARVTRQPDAAACAAVAH